MDTTIELYRFILGCIVFWSSLSSTNFASPYSSSFSPGRELVMESYGASETKVFLISERAADVGIALLLHSLLFSRLFFYPGAIREHQSLLPSAHTIRMGMGASVLSLQAAGLSAYSSSSNPFLWYIRSNPMVYSFRLDWRLMWKSLYRCHPFTKNTFLLG